ncbi:MAG: RadC family protein [Clostridia bacterium]|nr:RadC family protein [Clostridia bacterium]
MHEGHRKRMISKLFGKKEMLTDHEMLEILLFYTIPRKNTNEIAHALIDNFGNLYNCLTSPVDSLITVEGVGEKTAAFLVTVGEIFTRIDKQNNNLPIVFSYESSKKALIDSFKHYTEEKFLALFLNKKGQIILRKIFCSHSDNSVSVSVDNLLHGVLSQKPYSVVICHNHISGNCQPSFTDDKATEKIYLALRLHNVILYDHIIVSGDNSYSYHYEGRLEQIINNLKTIID